MNPLGVLHIPHSSAVIPPDLRSRFRVPDELIRRELLAMTDWYTDDLFALPQSEAATIRFPVSRLVLDPERFLDDQIEVMASRGMGLIYTRTSDGALLRNAPNPTERRALIKRFYEPHHASLAQAVRLALEEHGRCLVVDCHSFPSRARPCDLDQSTDRPDICIGTDPSHTPNWLTQIATGLLAAAGLSVEVNRPYSGSLVPAQYYGHQPSVGAIMIEVNRRLYIDEGSGEKRATFPEVAALIRGLVLGVLHGFRSQAAA